MIGLATLFFTACSFTTNFVVVNESDHVIEIRYRIKQPADGRPASLPINPAIKEVSQLGRQVAWQDLSASDYRVDHNERLVTVSLKPGYGLRIEQRNLVDGSQTDADRARNYAIEEITLIGNKGELHLSGEQARTSFLPQSKTLYTLTYK